MKGDFHMDKSTLLNTIRAKQAEFDEVIAQVGEEQWTTPGVNGAWSLKDLMAHMTAWEHVTLQRLHAAINGGELDIPLDKTLDEVNEEFYQENKDRSLADIMADYRQSYEHILADVEKMSDDALDDPHRFPWMDGEPFWKSVASDTFEHIEGHIGSIRDWLAA
jgi:hypothetical protein